VFQEKYHVDFGGQHLEGKFLVNVESKIGFVSELAYALGQRSNSEGRKSPQWDSAEHRPLQ
jgi:hypothetical protein